VRLNNYFIKPQMLFGLPPNCNVIFPSMTPQISYSESYITQPTRLYFQDSTLLDFPGLSNGDAATKQIFLASLSRAYPPDVDRKWQNRLSKGAAASSGRNLLVYPEEFFKGPVTSRYPAPSWLMFLTSQLQSAGIKPGDVVGDPNVKSTKPDSTSVNDSDASRLIAQDVYAIYAQYEYFRERFAQRNGAVSMAFNPYIVPGFPAAIFDDFQSRMHLIGYVMNADHVFTSSSVETSFNFTYARTLYEFFDLLGNEIDTGGATGSRKGVALAAGPAEPIKEIRDVIQQFDRAEQFYQVLLHRRQTVPAVFDYRQIIGYVRSDGTLEDIVIDGLGEEAISEREKELKDAQTILTEASNNSSLLASLFTGFEGVTLDDFTFSVFRPEITAIFRALGVANDATVVTLFPNSIATGLTALERKISALKPNSIHNLSGAREINPKPAFEPMFDSYDAAMQFASRPICTLEEYIEFIRGIREGINDEVAYTDGKGVPSARFYTRIRDLTGAAPDFKPTDAQRGVGADVPEAVNQTEAPEFPQMRADWQQVLLAYRANIYSTVRVQR
jgi:hypothetical protein